MGKDASSPEEPAGADKDLFLDSIIAEFAAQQGITAGEDASIDNILREIVTDADEDVEIVESDRRRSSRDAGVGPSRLRAHPCSFLLFNVVTMLRCAHRDLGARGWQWEAGREPPPERPPQGRPGQAVQAAASSSRHHQRPSPRRDRGGAGRRVPQEEDGGLCWGGPFGHPRSPHAPQALADFPFPSAPQLWDQYYRRKFDEGLPPFEAPLAGTVDAEFELDLTNEQVVAAAPSALPSGAAQRQLGAPQEAPAAAEAAAGPRDLEDEDASPEEIAAAARRLGDPDIIAKSDFVLLDDEDQKFDLDKNFAPNNM